MSTKGILALACFFSLCFSLPVQAANQTLQSDKHNNKKEVSAILPHSDKANNLTFATGGTAGIYFPLGGAIASAVNSHKKGDIHLIPQATGASVENIQLIHNKEADVAIAQSDIIYIAWNALAPFNEKTKSQNMRAIGRLYPEYLHIVARKESGITNIAELKHKKIAVGARGSGNEISCQRLLNIVGLDYKDITPVFLPYSEAIMQFQDGSIDAFIFIVGIPNYSIENLAKIQELNFISLDQEQRNKIIAKNPYLVEDIIPNGIYNMQNAVDTLSAQAILFVHKDLPEETAYKLTKAVYENVPSITQMHRVGAAISAVKARDGVTIPFHKGAEKYLQEQVAKASQKSNKKP